MAEVSANTSAVVFDGIRFFAFTDLFAGGYLKFCCSEEDIMGCLGVKCMHVMDINLIFVKENLYFFL